MIRLGDLPTLIKHGLHALRDTLQQDKELTIFNTSIAVVGLNPSTSENEKKSNFSEGKLVKFKIYEGEEIREWLGSMDPKDEGTRTGGEGEVGARGGDDVEMRDA
jgi:20S proteasome subunit alpha 6